MSVKKTASVETTVIMDASGADLLRPLMHAKSVKPELVANGVVIGECVGIAAEGCVPLVTYPGQPGTSALPARSVIDIDAPHIGRQVVLMLEAGDPSKPLIMGVLRVGDERTLPEVPGQVDVDADGRRLVV